jgi:formate hydrogenlyase subunit 4
MIELDHQHVVAVIAGILSGGFLGALIATKTEMERRGMPLEKVRPFDKVGGVRNFMHLILSTSMLLLLAGVGVLAIVLGTLHIGGVGGLQGDLYKVFAAAFVVGIVLTKSIRYLYWKNKS